MHTMRSKIDMQFHVWPNEACCVTNALRHEFSIRRIMQQRVHCAVRNKVGNETILLIIIVYWFEFEHQKSAEKSLSLSPSAYRSVYSHVHLCCWQMCMCFFLVCTFYGDVIKFFVLKLSVNERKKAMDCGRTTWEKNPMRENCRMLSMPPVLLLRLFFFHAIFSLLA